MFTEHLCARLCFGYKGHSSERNSRIVDRKWTVNKCILCQCYYVLRRNIKQDKQVERAKEGREGGVVILQKWSGKTSPKGSEGKNPVFPGGSAFQGKETAVQRP